MSMFDPNKLEQQEVPAEIKLEDIVGEGKKYATPEDLAKAYGNADSFITKMKAENAELRVKAEAKIQAEDFLKQLTTKEKADDPINNDPAQDPSKDNGQVDFEALLEKKLQERDSASSAKVNQQKVMEALIAKYGSRAGEVFQAKAKELNTDLDVLSAQSPDLVIQAFGAVSNAPSAHSPTGDKRPGQYDSNVTAEVGTKAHLTQLRTAGKLTRAQYFEACHKAMDADSVKFNSHK